MSTVFREVEVDGQRCDVLVRGDRVVEIGRRLDAPGAEEIDGAGGALIPGLHDHHLHLLSMASDLTSVACGPPHVGDMDQLASALRRAAAARAPEAWVRGTGYHESVAGDLDATALDLLVPDRPVRIQHRSGALWMLNTLALRSVQHVLDASPDVERGGEGVPTGRLWRYDERLRAALPSTTVDLGPVGVRLARLGITSVTDATPDLDEESFRLLTGAAGTTIPQDVCLLGAPLARPAGDARVGPWKILLRDHDLPDRDALAAEIGRARRGGRAVAIHCVTRVALVLTLAALERTGALPGDRIEHAAVVPPELASWLRRLGVSVVTQPGFIACRGDDYLRDVDAEDRPHLYPYASLLAAGIRTAPSSDAPFGPVDPWAVVAAAMHRRAASGRQVGAYEAAPAQSVLEGYLSCAHDPGGAPRLVRPGAPADLVLLATPWRECLADPDAERVRRVLKAGRAVHVRA